MMEALASLYSGTLTEGVGRVGKGRAGWTEVRGWGRQGKMKAVGEGSE